MVQEYFVDRLREIEKQSLATKMSLNTKQDAEAYVNRGLAYALMGQYERAIQDFTEAIRLNPQDAEAYYVRGLIYGELGKSDEAARDFAKAKELGYDP